MEPGELSVTQNGKTAPVLRLEQLTADRARMQLFILLDDSSRSSSLGVQIPELKSFIGALPATTEVAVGYMHNGTFSVAQAFTADHQQAAKAVRLPVGIPGENGSPYFALSSLVKHWPSSETAGRRAVVMLTDGVDRYFTSTMVNDPYVDAAAHDAVRHGIMVYSIYLRGAGIYGRGGWATNVAQIAADAGER